MLDLYRTIMKKAIQKCWRDSATLIVATKRKQNFTPVNRETGNCNYDILLQTRTHNASFPNSVVFPGGVCEAADGDEEWYKYLRSFGYTENDFNSFHRIGSQLTPLFENNPIQRHVALRITAIRETFEELGLLICSQSKKSERNTDWASLLTYDDLKHWRERVSKNPAELLTLCKEYKCYPDIWALHYWSNWLTPVIQPKRFDAAFFVTALENKPTIYSNSEVVNVKWSTPTEILKSSGKAEVLLYPPQVYEFSRLSYLPDINELITFAKERSSRGNILLYIVPVQAKDGVIELLPGDYLYPSNVDFNTQSDPKNDKTILELRGKNQQLHRIEVTRQKRELIIQNYQPANHIAMNNVIVPFPSKAV